MHEAPNAPDTPARVEAKEPTMPSCVFAYPGDWETRTGGYRYDRRIVAGLAELGWRVERLALGAGYPQPDTAALAAAEAVFAALPDGTLVVVDGLAFGALPEVAERHAARLRWVALVHHPLWLETGLDPAVQQSLRESERRALAAARRVIVTSASTAGDVRALGVPDARVRVVEPGTDRAPLAAGSPPGTRLRLLCIASLLPRKGHGVLVEALAGLADRARHADWTLHCHGGLHHDPAHVQAVRAAIDAHGLADRVLLLGEADDAALERAYAEADVFLLRSFYVGYGMVLTEAIAHGLPVVSTTGGAIAQTLPPEASLCVPPADAAALRDALARVIDDPDCRATLAAGARAARERLAGWPEASTRFAEALGLESALGAGDDGGREGGHEGAARRSPA